MKKLSAIDTLRAAAQSGSALDLSKVMETARLGSWYVYISQYKRLNPIEYMRVFVPAVTIVGSEEWVPPQFLFRQATDVFEGFLSKKISLEALDKFQNAVAEIEPKLLPVYESVKTGKWILPDRGDDNSYVYNPLRCILTSAYPGLLLRAVQPFIDKHGIVSYPPEQKMLLDDIVKMGAESFETPISPAP